jgi:hypothetical protein
MARTNTRRDTRAYEAPNDAPDSFVVTNELASGRKLGRGCLLSASHNQGKELLGGEPIEMRHPKHAKPVRSKAEHATQRELPAFDEEKTDDSVELLEPNHFGDNFDDARANARDPQRYFHARVVRQPAVGARWAMPENKPRVQRDRDFLALISVGDRRVF